MSAEDRAKESAKSLGREGLAGAVFGVIVGVGLCVVAVFGYVRFTMYNGFTDHFSTIGAIFLLFLVAWPLNALARRFLKKGLKAADLGIIYFCLMIATALPSMGFGGYVFTLPSGPTYYGNSKNNWHETIVRETPDGIIPKDVAAIRNFYEGNPPGAPIPWGVWLAPLTYWGAVYVVLAIFSIALMVLFRRQWAEHERLSYPLTILPLELIAGRSEFRQPVYRMATFWVTFGLALAYASYTTVTRLLAGLFTMSFPLLPGTRWIDIFGHATSIGFTFDPGTIGLGYLFSLEALAGIWFFQLLATLETGMMSLAGIPQGSAGPFGSGGLLLTMQQTGSLVFLVIAAIWSARHHLAATLRGIADDRLEIMSYRTAWLLVAGGALILVLLLQAGGLPLGYAMWLLLCAVVLFLGTTLVLCQTGVAYRAPYSAGALALDLTGSAGLDSAAISALGLSEIWCGDTQVFTMGTAAQGLKVLHDAPGPRPRRALAAGLVTLVGSLLAVYVCYLVFGYRYGELSGYSWYSQGAPQYVWAWASSKLGASVAPQRSSFGMMLAGGAVTAGVMALHHRFLWWGLHPVGLAICGSGPVRINWFSLFLAWVAKITVLHYGGLGTFRATLPIAIALILGASTGASLSFFLNMVFP